ncbi:MAG: hypothetical protein AAGF90_22355, partial [Pseudomonadota bacterium]
MTEKRRPCARSSDLLGRIRIRALRKLPSAAIVLSLTGCADQVPRADPVEAAEWTLVEVVSLGPNDSTLDSVSIDEAGEATPAVEWAAECLDRAPLSVAWIEDELWFGAGRVAATKVVQKSGVVEFLVFDSVTDQNEHARILKEAFEAFKREQRDPNYVAPGIPTLPSKMSFRVRGRADAAYLDAGRGCLGK